MPFSRTAHLLFLIMFSLYIPQAEASSQMDTPSIIEVINPVTQTDEFIETCWKIGDKDFKNYDAYFEKNPITCLRNGLYAAIQISSNGAKIDVIKDVIQNIESDVLELKKRIRDECLKGKCTDFPDFDDDMDHLMSEYAGVTFFYQNKLEAFSRHNEALSEMDLEKEEETAYNSLEKMVDESLREARERNSFGRIDENSTTSKEKDSPLVPALIIILSIVSLLCLFGVYRMSLWNKKESKYKTFKLRVRHAFVLLLTTALIKIFLVLLPLILFGDPYRALYFSYDMIHILDQIFIVVAIYTFILLLYLWQKPTLKKIWQKQKVQNSLFIFGILYGVIGAVHAFYFLVKWRFFECTKDSWLGFFWCPDSAVAFLKYGLELFIWPLNYI